MSYRITPRIAYSAALLVCLALLAFALYLQYVEHQEPCPLCIFQRIAFFSMMLVMLVGAVHGPGRRGAIVSSGIVVVIAIIGAAIAARHVWLQHLPANLVPACGPGLGYMFERFPFTQVLQKVLAGSGECAEVGWTFMGLSIAGWSLVWFLILGVFAALVPMQAKVVRHARPIESRAAV